MVTSRRQFVGLLGTSVSASAVGLAPPQRALDTGSDPATVRSQFAFPDAKIPMNAANLCPSPRSVADAVAHYTQVIDLDPSFQNRSQFNKLLETSRQAVAAPLGVSPDEIALVRNTSEANNIINNGLDLQPGDEVIVWDQNHPTNNVAWDVRARRFGLIIKRVSVAANPTSVEELLEPFRRALTERTRVLTVTHVSNVSGLKLPARELGALCRSRKVHFHLDGAQSWGALDLDLPTIGCDSFSGSAHKWFMGPKEVGLLYVRTDAIERIWPNTIAPGWGADADTDLTGARKFESLGQRDDAALAALATAAGLHAAVGTAAVEQHMVQLAQQLKAGLIDAGAALLTPMAPEFSAGVCIAQVRKENRGELFDRMYREHGIIAAPTGGLRLSPHLYNTPEHIERAVAGVRALRELLV